MARYADESHTCHTCLYFSNVNYLPSCDYYLLTGRRRGCEGGDHCERFYPNDKMKSLIGLYTGDNAPDIDKALLGYYEKGMTDAQIAQAMGTTQSTIYHWRRRFGLPSQNELREECDED